MKLTVADFEIDENGITIKGSVSVCPSYSGLSSDYFLVEFLTNLEHPKPQK